MKKKLRYLFALFAMPVLMFCAGAQAKESKTPGSDIRCADLRQYTFSWPYQDACNMTPRGGTTHGAKVTLDPQPYSGWLSLLQENLSSFEKDRRAILAMAGPYRVSFDFLETVGYTTGFKPDRPYHSWTTEYVYVIEDSDNFISLQHIMVMFFADGDKVSEPMVMKHWRQDWRYEGRELLEYAGNNIWQRRKLSSREVKGAWVQSVYQVDDSPRYAAYGRWEHKPNFSTWIGGKTWRPLPRREFSVRDDYQVLEGFNRHTIVPDGWVHEEENYKVALDGGGKPRIDSPYLAKELGVNRYQKIIGHDFSAGDRYWRQTASFWRDVRLIWAEIISSHDGITLKRVNEGEQLFTPLFKYAEKLQGESYDQAAGKQFIKATLMNYLI